MASPNPQPSSASLIDGDNALFDIEHGDREDDELLPNRATDDQTHPALPPSPPLQPTATSPVLPSPATSEAPPRYSIALDDERAGSSSGAGGSSSGAGQSSSLAGPSRPQGPIDQEVAGFTHDVDALFNHLDSFRGAPSEKLPTYVEAVQAPATAVRLGDGTTVVSTSAAGVSVSTVNPFIQPYERYHGYDEEVYVEGWPVGNWVIFILNAIASMAFDFIGFVLTFFLATSHAAREGARAGLGLTLIRYGLYVQDHAADPDPMEKWEEELEKEVEEAAEARMNSSSKNGTHGGMMGNGTKGMMNGSMDGMMGGKDDDGKDNSTINLNITEALKDADVSVTFIPATPASDSSSTTSAIASAIATATATPILNATQQLINSTTSINGTIAPHLSLFSRQSDATIAARTQFNMVIGILLMSIGWILLFKSIVAFLRARRMERLALYRASTGSSGPAAVESGVEAWLSNFGVWPALNASATNEFSENADEPPAEARESRESEDAAGQGEIALGDEESGQERPRWWLRRDV